LKCFEWDSIIHNTYREVASLNNQLLSFVSRFHFIFLLFFLFVGDASCGPSDGFKRYYLRSASVGALQPSYSMFVYDFAHFQKFFKSSPLYFLPKLSYICLAHILYICLAHILCSAWGKYNHRGMQKRNDITICYKRLIILYQIANIISGNKLSDHYFMVSYQDMFDIISTTYTWKFINLD
jgi:hypothetical protein